MIHVQIGRFSLFTVFWPTYDPQRDEMRKRCFRVRWL